MEWLRIEECHDGLRFGLFQASRSLARPGNEPGDLSGRPKEVLTGIEGSRGPGRTDWADEKGRPPVERWPGD